MLNEIIEYNQYVMPLEGNIAPRDCRLKFATLIKREFSGLERALTVIARYHIFNAENSDFDEERIKNILKAWCGFSHEACPPELENWLPAYIRKIFLEVKLRDCRRELEAVDSENIPAELFDFFRDFKADADIVTLTGKSIAFDALKNVATKNIKDNMGKINCTVDALAALREKSKYFGKSMFANVSAKDNDYKKLNCDRIIANALQLGRLQKYYLVCNDNPFEQKFVAKFTPAKKDKGKNLLPSDKDLILKLTAAYLLKRRDTNQKFVVVNQSDVANWLVEKSDPKKFDLEKYMLTDSREFLFTSEVKSNVKKFKVHPAWAEKFCLVAEEKFLPDENRGRIFFADSGCGSHLVEGKKYDK